MAPNQQTNCVFCKRNEPHEKHLTLLEYTRIFGGMNAYDNTVLGKSVANVVVAGSAKQRVA